MPQFFNEFNDKWRIGWNYTEERLTKIKNQAGFPLLAVKALINQHLEGNFNAVDVVVAGSKTYDPYLLLLSKIY